MDRMHGAWTFGFIVGVIAMSLLMLRMGLWRTEAFERGRCTGWADAAGLVPAWDEDGACVLGGHPEEVPVDGVMCEEAP